MADAAGASASSGLRESMMRKMALECGGDISASQEELLARSSFLGGGGGASARDDGVEEEEEVFSTPVHSQDPITMCTLPFTQSQAPRASPVPLPSQPQSPPQPAPRASPAPLPSQPQSPPPAPPAAPVHLLDGNDDDEDDADTAAIKRRRRPRVCTRKVRGARIRTPTPSPEKQPTPSPKQQPTPCPKQQPTPSPEKQPTPSPKQQPTPSRKQQGQQHLHVDNVDPLYKAVLMIPTAATATTALTSVEDLLALARQRGIF